MPRWNAVSSLSPYKNERSFNPIREEQILEAQRLAFDEPDLTEVRKDKKRNNFSRRISGKTT